MTEAVRTALVTGANKGIGFEIARQLAGLGFRVFMGARDAERGQAAAKALVEEGLNVTFLPLDVTDDASVANAAERLTREVGALDVLVNNAGVAIDGDASPADLSLDVLKATYDVNVFGAVRTLQAFLPLLLKAPAARIVVVGSKGGSLGLQAEQRIRGNPLAYFSSKSAVHGVMLAFANLLRNSPIKVNAVCPGHVSTDLSRRTGTRTPEQGAGIAVRFATLGPDGPTGGYFDDQGPLPW